MTKNNKYRSRRNDRYDGPRKNHMIKSREVRLIDENDENVGVVPLEDALRRANEAQKDLIEVSPNAKPPVVKIMDYSKYLYEQKKKMKQNKEATKQKDMKEFRFSPVIEENDIAFRTKRALYYLDKGHNVRITMYRKGRQTKEQADKKFAEILTIFEGYSSIEADPKREGRRTFITFKSDGKAKKSENSTEKAEEDKSKGKKEG